MKRLFFLLAVMVSLLFMGCGFFDGDAFGSISWDYSTSRFWTYSDFSSTSGFPSTVSSGNYYQVSPGYHYFYYYMSNLDDTVETSVYLAEYDVEIYPGTIGSPGSDRYFDMYFYPDGTWEGAWLNSASSPRSLGGSLPANGAAVVYSNGSTAITVTVTKVGPGFVPPSSAVEMK